jgi:hypothetical protein
MITFYGTTSYNTCVSDPYYPLGTISTAPRAYSILGPKKEWKGEQIQITK